MQSMFSLTQRNADSSDGACSPSTARVHLIPCEFRFLHQSTAALRSGRAHLPEMSVIVNFLSVLEKGKTQLADEGTQFFLRVKNKTSGNIQKNYCRGILIFSNIKRATLSFQDL
jgi:hypothetical protein